MNLGPTECGVVKDTCKLYGTTIQFWHAKISVNPRVEWVMMPSSMWLGPVLFIMPNHSVWWRKNLIFPSLLSLVMCHSMILYKEALKQSLMWGGGRVCWFFVINIKGKGQGQNVDILRYKVVQIWPGLICTNIHTNQSRSYLNHLV